MEELIELREIDIRSILKSPVDAEPSIFEKLISSNSKMYSDLAEKYQYYSDSEKEFTSCSTKSKHLVSELNNKISDAVNCKEKKDFNQKRLDKEISNCINFKETTKAKLEKLKKERESLTLEITEKENELEKKKEEMKKDWNAIKKACFIYKDKLDMQIRGEFSLDCEDITVTFFYKKFDDKYCIHLSRRDTIWRVTKIKPELSAEHQKELSTVVNFSSDSKIINLTAFLCKIRKIFLKYYCT